MSKFEMQDNFRSLLPKNQDMCTTQYEYLQANAGKYRGVMAYSVGYNITQALQTIMEFNVSTFDIGFHKKVTSAISTHATHKNKASDFFLKEIPADKPRTRHHLCPSSRGGTNDPDNIRYLAMDKHAEFHHIFGNLTPTEQLWLMSRWHSRDHNEALYMGLIQAINKSRAIYKENVIISA